jgi:hypothetical protein
MNTPWTTRTSCYVDPKSMRGFVTSVLLVLRCFGDLPFDCFELPDDQLRYIDGKQTTAKPILKPNLVANNQ